MVEVHRVAVDEWTSIKFHKRSSLLKYTNKTVLGNDIVNSCKIRNCYIHCVYLLEGQFPDKIQYLKYEVFMVSVCKEMINQISVTMIQNNCRIDYHLMPLQPDKAAMNRSFAR